MKIDHGSSSIKDVTDEDLEVHLRLVETAEEEFLILVDEDRDNYFMQVAGEGDSFYVEYRVDTEDQHFSTVENVSFQKTMELLRAFLHSDESYKTAVEWKPLETGGGCSKTAALILLAIVGVVTWLV